ncbi:hypothetical protein Droror1_Dr00028081 [Drosera rotundifolia]
MGLSLPARKHPVLTTLRDTKAQGTGEFPLPLAGQPGRERGGNGLPKKPARAGVSIEGDGPNVVLAKSTSWVAGGEKRTWGLGSERSVTKRAIPFRARQNGRARAV